MKNHQRIALRIFLLAIVLLAGIFIAAWNVTPVSASSELPTLPHSCSGAVPSGGSTPGSEAAIARIEAPTTRSIDADWPIVGRSVRIVRDRSGKVYTITDITRQDPNPKKPTNLLASSSCTFLQSTSRTTQTSAGVVSQYLKNYFYWYRWSDPTHYVYAYWNYKTETWWTRTDSTWSITSGNVTWVFKGLDCSSVHRTYTAGGSVVPGWYNGGNETWHYLWDVTNSWVTLTSQVQLGDYLATDLDSNYRNSSGTVNGSMHSEVVW